MAQLQTMAALDKLMAAQLDDTGAVGTDGPLKGAKLVLFSGNPGLDKDTALADLTEAVYSGYAQSAAVTFLGAFREDDGSYSKTSVSVLFKSTTGTPYVPDTVTGVGVISSGGSPVLLAAGFLDTPKSFAHVDDGITISVAFNLGAISGNSEILVDD